MIKVLIANIISLIFSLLTNFILPKFLSDAAYAGIKTFQLYIMYVGLLHFGYEDGMYLKYGGKSIKQINTSELENSIYTLSVFQLIVAMITIIISLILNNYILLAFSFAILPVNIVAYYKLLFQAVGEFDKYGRIMNLTSIVTFLINSILVFIVKTDNCYLFIWLYVVWDLLLWFILNMYSKKLLRINNRKHQFSMVELKVNIKTGLPLTLGNLSSVLLTSIDRWFVKYLLTTVDFARYSFAVSTESFINVAITPITVTLYNYFCQHSEKEKIVTIRKVVLVFASFLVSCAFGAKFIIEHFLTKYEDSIIVLFVLFSAQICFVPIKGVYVNLYKAQSKQNIYFRKLLFVVLFGIATNAIFYLLMKQKEVFAFTTLGSALFWLVTCVKDFKNIPMRINEWIYLLLSVIGFIICGVYFNSVIGFFLYMIVVCLLGILFMKNELFYLFNIIKNSFRSLIYRLDKNTI